MFSLCRIVIAQTLIILVYGECVDPWIQFQDSCYFFDDAQANWFAAEDACRRYFDAYLVEIESAEENAFIKSKARTIHAAAEPNRRLGYLIGGSDQKNEGTFEWMTSGHQFNYTDWLPTQPDSTDLHEDCVHLYAKYDYGWNDISCTAPLSFICEKKASIVVDPTLSD